MPVQMVPHMGPRWSPSCPCAGPVSRMAWTGGDWEPTGNRATRKRSQNGLPEGFDDKDSTSLNFDLDDADTNLASLVLT